MSAAQAKAHFDRQVGDPETGYVGADDVDAAIDQIYADMPDVTGHVTDTRTVTAGSGLTGGGDLSADRTIAVSWGTGASNVRHGNDAAYTNARTPTAHASSHVATGDDPISVVELGADPAGSADDALTAAQASSCQKDQNLSDVVDAAAALSNLGGAPALLSEVTYTADTTLSLSDAGSLLRINSASAVEVTVPPNASVAFPVGSQILLVQYGAGQVRVVAGAGVTLRSAYGRTRLAAQYDQASLIKRATNEWYLAGGLTQ